MNILNYFTEEAKHLRSLKKLGIEPLYEASTGKVSPTLEDTTEEGERLSLRELQSIAKSICPDCGGEIRWGPCGGMMQNVKCFGECGAKFNFCEGLPPLSARLEGKVTI